MWCTLLYLPLLKTYIKMSFPTLILHKRERGMVSLAIWKDAIWKEEDCLSLTKGSKWKYSYIRHFWTAMCVLSNHFKKTNRISRTAQHAHRQDSISRKSISLGSIIIIIFIFIKNILHKNNVYHLHPSITVKSVLSYRYQTSYITKCPDYTYIQRNIYRKSWMITTVDQDMGL